VGYKAASITCILGNHELKILNFRRMSVQITLYLYYIVPGIIIIVGTSLVHKKSGWTIAQLRGALHAKTHVLTLISNNNNNNNIRAAPIARGYYINILLCIIHLHTIIRPCHMNGHYDVWAYFIVGPRITLTSLSEYAFIHRLS